MNDPTLERHPIETLASEFTDRIRAGEQPTVQAYIEANPHVADEIRELFPTIAAMEKLKSHKESRSGGRVSLGPTRLEQLGDFRIVREIGRGGMGIVYEAEQLSLGRRVAVKVLPKQSLLDEKHLLRFRREAKTAAKLHHTNIVPVLGVGEHDGFHFIVMQYIRGVGLDEIVPHLAQLGSTGATPPRSDPKTEQESRRDAQISDVARAIFDGKFTAVAAASDSSIASSLRGNVDGEMSAGTSIGFELGPLSTSANRPGPLPTKSFIQDRPDRTDSSANHAAADQLNVDLSDLDEASEVPSSSVFPMSSATPTPGQPEGTNRTRMTTKYWRSVARIGAQVASAIHYAHEHGTLHRDIKPANLLIDQQGSVWVADFGLAKAVEHDDVSRTGDVVGTLRYMAPEQLLGHADRRSDLFSLGLTLYELLTFRPAYDEADRKKCLLQRSVAPVPTLPHKLVAGVPKDLETIVLKAIADEPQQRYASAAEMAEDLERFLEDRPILARRATPLEHLWRWCRRNPAVATLASIAATLLIVVAIVSTTGYVQTTNAIKKTNAALKSEKQQLRKAQATSELAWDALDRIFSRFAPPSVVTAYSLTLENEQGDELAVESPVVLSDQAATLLEELLTFYDRLAAQGDNDVDFQRRIADAHQRVGAIQQRLGRNAQAELAYERAIEIYAQISSPMDAPNIRVAIAVLHNELGTIAAKTGRYTDAVDEYSISQRLLEALDAKATSPAIQYELAHTYYLQSWPFRSGGRRGSSGSGRQRRTGSAARPDRQRGDADRSGDRSRYDLLCQAISILEALDQHDPEVPKYQQLLAMTYVARAKQNAQDVLGCKRSIGSAVSILNSLVERFPHDPDFRFALATAYATEIPGDDDRSPLDRREEITRLLASQSILKELQREHPNVPEYVESEANGQRRLGRQYARLGEFDKAMVHLEAGINAQELLARNHPTVNIYAIRLAIMRQSYASELRRAYDTDPENNRFLLEKARVQLAATMPRSLDVMRSPVDDPRMRAMLGYFVLGNFRAIGEICVELGDDDGAIAAWTAAEEFREEFKIPEFNSRGGSSNTGTRSNGGTRGNGGTQGTRRESRGAPTGGTQRGERPPLESPDDAGL